MPCDDADTTTKSPRTNAHDTWLCPQHPFGHTWSPDKLRCSLCGAERTASEAIASGLASLRGWNEAAAEHVIAAHRTQVLREAAQNGTRDRPLPPKVAPATTAPSTPASTTEPSPHQ